MSDNLLELQRSAKPIRNPFGTTFKTTWNSEAVELKGDGQWYTYVGRLADHIANRLWQKVTYKLHDMEVAKLKIAGRPQEARKFHLSDAMKNKVWMVITGQPHPKYKDGVLDLVEDDMDFSVLQQDMKAIDQAAVMSAQATSVASVLQEASDAAMRDLDMGGDSHSSHSQGTVSFGQPVDPKAGSLPTQPIVADETPDFLRPAPGEPQVPQPPAPEDVAAQAEEFPGIKELD